jgi:UDP-N-acetylglucosamine pyrophosphorylase
MGHEEELRRVKAQKSTDFAEDTINYLTFSMWKDTEAKLRNSYDQARKEAQFYKDKYFAAEKKYHARLASFEQQGEASPNVK